MITSGLSPACQTSCRRSKAAPGGKHPDFCAGSDQSVEADQVRLDPLAAHCVKQLPNIVEAAGAGVHAHHGVEHLHGGALPGEAEEDLLREPVLASATEDPEQGAMMWGPRVRCRSPRATLKASSARR